jgi:Spy/CpxP family protein refolding chaperone
MKSNKSHFFALIALGGLMALSPIAYADDSNIPSPAKPAPGADEPGPGGRPNMRAQMDKLLADIKATDDQKEKLKPIFKERNDKMKTLRDDTALSQEDRVAKRKEIMEAITAKVKTVLDADQFKKYEEFQKEMMKRMQGRRQQPPADGAAKDPAPKN